jgi:hypothetical protein
MVLAFSLSLLRKRIVKPAFAGLCIADWHYAKALEILEAKSLTKRIFRCNSSPRNLGVGPAMPTPQGFFLPDGDGGQERVSLQKRN